MPRRRSDELTGRQRDILRMIAAGKTNSEIAERLGISLDGAKYHVSEIIAKLGVDSREKAAEWWKSAERPLARFARGLWHGLTGAGWLRAGSALSAVAGASALTVVAITLANSGDSSAPSSASECPVTIPAQPYVASPPYPAAPPSLYGSAWYGTDRLWTMLHPSGEQWELTLRNNSFTQKTFWWSQKFGEAGAEEPPAISVTGRRLDGPGNFTAGNPGTNATADFGKAMLVGVSIPSAGCWEIRATYKGSELAYVVRVVEHASVPSSAVPSTLASATIQPTSTLPPATAIPDGQVAFRSCGETVGYRKLTPAEMHDVFTNKRFGDGVRLYPFDWAIYISDFYWNRLPQAISANVENNALSQGTATAGATASAVNNVCPPPNWESLSFQALTLYDHRVSSLSVASGTLTVKVESLPSSVGRIEFPEPSPLRQITLDKDAPPLVDLLRIVDASGHLLLMEGPNAERWEFEDDGDVRSGTISSLGSPSTVTLRTASDLELFCGRAYRAPAGVTFSSAGRAPVVVKASCGDTWAPAAAVHLDPGEWTISVDGSAYYTVLPKDGPRP